MVVGLLHKKLKLHDGTYSVEKNPETFDVLVDVCQKSKDAGVTPIAADAQKYGVLWLWWSLVSTHADRKCIDDRHM